MQYREYKWTKTCSRPVHEAAWSFRAQCGGTGSAAARGRQRSSRQTLDPAAQLDAACAAFDDGAHRMRLALNASGTFTLQSAPLAALAQPVRVLVAQQPTFPQDVFLRHKTSIRSTYDAAWRAAEAQGLRYPVLQRAR